ncbi:MAG: hypothetical protein ACYC7L_11675 [Nitrospirota bacterium]
MATAQNIAAIGVFLLKGRKKYIKTVWSSQEVSTPSFAKLQL